MGSIGSQRIVLSAGQCKFCLSAASLSPKVPISYFRARGAAGSVRSIATQATSSSLFGQRLAGHSVLGFKVQSSLRFPSMGASASSTTGTEKSLHGFTVKDNAGNDVDLSIYKGKVLLVVNVASRCGLTQTNYTELTELYNKYKGNGFEILAFPSNQFGGQEPGTNEQIKEFACSRFKAEFPIFDKVDVNGPNEAPVYKFLKSTSDDIKWNFAKFLIDKDGVTVERYPPTTSPLKLEEEVKKLLGA